MSFFQSEGESKQTHKDFPYTLTIKHKGHFMNNIVVLSLALLVVSCGKGGGSSKSTETHESLEALETQRIVDISSMGPGELSKQADFPLATKN
jgi:hypothetical protein